MRNKSYWRINKNIHAPKIRVIGADGKQIGVISRKEALDLAKKAKLDLVEIAPKAKPPVAKIVDFGKFRYREEKKLRKQKKKSKGGELKEVRFSPFIAQGDYETRFRKLDKFLRENYKVRVVVVFKGRQMGSKKFGYQLIDRITEELGDRISVDMEPKFLGRHLAMVISPLSKAKRAEKSNKKKGKDGKAKNSKVDK